MAIAVGHASTLFDKKKAIPLSYVSIPTKEDIARHKADIVAGKEPPFTVGMFPHPVIAETGEPIAGVTACSVSSAVDDITMMTFTVHVHRLEEDED